ncbi:hypothetical protein D3C86_1726770 [compost metagenome]
MLQAYKQSLFIGFLRLRNTQAVNLSLRFTQSLGNDRLRNGSSNYGIRETNPVLTIKVSGDLNYTYGFRANSSKRGNLLAKINRHQKARPNEDRLLLHSSNLAIALAREISRRVDFAVLRRVQLPEWEK